MNFGIQLATLVIVCGGVSVMRVMADVTAFSIFQYLMKMFGHILPSPAGVTRDEKYFEAEYDFVVIGAGSAGSVVANRLTEVFQWSVLLIEAGKDEKAVLNVPLLAAYVVGTDYNWGYKTERMSGACLGMKKQRCHWPRGKAVGGTSVINFMVYTRGFQKDYDDWEALGNYGWGFPDVLHYFLKSEDIQDAELFGSKYHARGGYLKVSRPRWVSPIAPAFFAACRELGYNMTDPNGPDAIGCSFVLSNIDGGSRYSASKAFLRPIRKRPNLHVSKESHVTKILVDPATKRAYGVQFVKNRQRYTVRARKEVIVCAGTLNSPQLLMLSGIGPAQHLKDLGIPVLQNSRVGYNLQDHVSMSGLAFLVNDSVTIVESRYYHPRYFFEYVKGRGPYTLPGGAEAVLFTRSKYSSDNDGRTPDMELVFGPGALTGDTGGSLRSMLNLDDELVKEVYGPYMGRDAWSLVPVLLRPKSRGYMKLKSKNPFDPPLFYPNYLSDERDVLTIVDGIKQAIEVSRTASFQRYASEVLSNPVPGCRHLSFGSDHYWMCVARYITTSLQHQVGTCKMGPDSDSEAVVDPELRVRGIRGLRVADCSIMPIIPAGHTNSMAFMIGEKAADMIKSTWLSNNEMDKVHIRLS